MGPFFSVSRQGSSGSLVPLRYAGTRTVEDASILSGADFSKATSSSGTKASWPPVRQNGCPSSNVSCARPQQSPVTVTAASCARYSADWTQGPPATCPLRVRPNSCTVSAGLLRPSAPRNLYSSLRAMRPALLSLDHPCGAVSFKHTVSNTQVVHQYLAQA